MNSEIKRKTLLLVDDLELFLQLQIPRQGNSRFMIHTARSGREILDMAHFTNPQLTIFDGSMPDMKGEAICRILKADHRTSSVPIILIRGKGEEEAVKKSLSAGACAALCRPIDREILLSTMEYCLGIKIRRQVRADVFIPSSLFLDEIESDATIRSLSLNGAFVETGDSDVIVGDIVELRFNLPGSEKEITVRNAAVVWHGTCQGGGVYGMGIRFLDVLPESSFLVALYLESLLRKDAREERLLPEVYGSGIM